MTLTVSDISYQKSKVVIDGNTNGGRYSESKVISGARHSLFPRVTKANRINGFTRYRKQFWKNSNIENLPAYDLLQYIEVPSNGGDIFYITKGTDTDTQSNLVSPPAGSVIQWFGAGHLSTQLTGGESSISLIMESPNFVFPNGGFLHIANKIKLSQTIATNVVVGDSVTYLNGSWSRISSTADIVYPKGLFLGDGKVLTIEETTKEEWLTIAENLYTDEIIGEGDGVSTNPALSTLTHKTNGICQVVDKLPIITTQTASNTTLTAYLKQDGSVDTSQGNGTAGQLNMTTGIWTTPITWNQTPGDEKDILITYREKPYSYVSNTVTVSLDTQVANSYPVQATVASVCLHDALVQATVSSVVLTSASGTFDNETSPIVAQNEGAVYDTITCTFTSGSSYTVTGLNSGSLGFGNVSTNASVANPETGKPMVIIPAAAWSGSFSSGDTLVFVLFPATSAMWVKEEVPEGTEKESHNLCVFGYYLE